MAGPIIVESPVITWPSSPIANSTITWQTATVNQTGDVGAYLTTSNVNKIVNNLREWSGSLDGFMGTPISGNALSITYDSGYDLMCESWSFSATVDSRGYYASGTGSNRWRNFLPSTLRWTASSTHLVDNADPIFNVAQDSSPAAILLQLSSGNTIAGNVLSSSVATVVPIGDLLRVTVNYVGDASPVIVGSNNIVTAVSPLAKMAASALSITAHEAGANDVRYSGNAFWTGLNVTVTDSGLITYNVPFQGSGALTITDPTDPS